MPLTLANFFSMAPDQIIYTVLLPFIIAFTIFWALLSSMRIFGSKVNIVISFVLAMGLFFTDAYVFLGQFIFASGTFLATGIFILIFGVGVIIWAFQRTKGIYYETGELNRLYKDRNKILEKIRRSREDEKGPLYKQLTEIDAMIKAKEAERYSG